MEIFELLFNIEFFFILNDGFESYMKDHGGSLLRSSILRRNECSMLLGF